MPLSHHILSTIFTRTASTIFNFLLAVLIVRYSGAGVKGDVTLIVTTISFFVFFSNFLGGQALVYLISRGKIELLVVPAYIWALSVAVLGFLFMRYSGIVSQMHVTSIAMLSLLTSLTSIHQTVLIARQRFTPANFITIISLTLQLAGILVCYLVFSISDTYAFIYASLGAYVVALIVSFYFVLPMVPFRNFLSHFTRKEIFRSIRSGLLYQSVEVLQLLNLRYYFYQLGLQQGIQYLGVYSIGISILETVWIIPRSISTVHYVSVSNSDEIKHETERTLRLGKITFILCALSLLLIYLIPASAYAYVFGEEFRRVKHATRFLYPGILIYSVVIVVSSFYLGTGNYKPLIISYAAGALTMAVTSFFLLPPYVISGAGLAATLSFSVTAIVLAWYFIDRNSIRLPQLIIRKQDVNAIGTVIQSYLR